MAEAYDYCSVTLFSGYAAYEQFGNKEQAVKVKQRKSEAVMKEIIARNGIEIGKSAPDFELTKLDGTNVKLSDLKGKKVILNFGLRGVDHVSKKCLIWRLSIKNIKKT